MSSGLPIELARALLTPPTVTPFDDAAAFLAEAGAYSFDAAVLSSTRVSPLGYAFAAAYQAALVRLVPGRGGAAAFAVTEEGGGHPRAILSTLAPKGPNYTLSGTKTWVTLGTEGQHFLVAARLAGEDVDGHPVLRLVVVRRDAPGVTIEALEKTPFVPEIPHARLVLDEVAIAASDVLLGDGYADYVKPFRTVEDAHVLGAVTSWILAWASRTSAPEDLRFRLLAIVSGAREAALFDPKSPEGHLVLAGLFATLRAFTHENAALFAAFPEAIRAIWERDRVLLGVGGKAREARTKKALAAL